jgi:hypothetical protein
MYGTNSQKLRQKMILHHRAKYRLFAIVISLFVVLPIVFPVVHSQATPPTNTGSITISPAIINLPLPSGQQDASTTISLASNYSKTVRLTAEWQSIDEATGRLIPAGPLDPVLAQSLRVSETDILIAPQSSKRLTVAVHNTPALAPGGHYGILLFTVVAEGKDKLGLQSALSVTVFIVKRDGAKAEISLGAVSATHSLFSLPRSGSTTVTNIGNIHVVPHAAITIEHGNETVAKAVLNQASSPLLPGKKATYQASFVKLKNLYWPAQLQLRSVYHFDSSGEVHEKITHFWYIPPFWPFLIVILGVGLYFGIKKGRPVAARTYHQSKQFVAQRKSVRSTAPEVEPSPVSRIPVSSVEISPSHSVPVGLTQPKQLQSKRATNNSAKSTKKKPSKLKDRR